MGFLAFLGGVLLLVGVVGMCTGAPFDRNKTVSELLEYAFWTAGLIFIGALLFGSQQRLPAALAASSVPMAIAGYRIWGLIGDLSERFLWSDEMGRSMYAILSLMGIFGGAVGLVVLEETADVPAPKLDLANVEMTPKRPPSHTSTEPVQAPEPWKPGPGMSEVKVGMVIAWLAIPPKTVIDWEYEQELDRTAQAKREIPIKVVLLNDTFDKDSVLRAERSPDGELWLWRVRISEPDSQQVLREWPRGAGTAEIRLPPGARRDYSFYWDGRDENGTLLPPGTYTASLFTAEIASEGRPIRAQVTFHIENRGPIKKVIPDPFVEWCRFQEQQNRIHREMMQNMNLGRSIEAQLRSLDRLGR